MTIAVYILFTELHSYILFVNKSIINLFLGNYKSREDVTLTHDLEKEISPESPVHHRTKVIKDLCDAVLNQQWEDVGRLFIIINLY